MAGNTGDRCENCGHKAGEPRFTVEQIYRLEYWREQAKAHDHAPTLLLTHWTEKEGNRWVEHVNLVPLAAHE